MKKKPEVLLEPVPVRAVPKEAHWGVFITLKDGKEESFPIPEKGIIDIKQAISEYGDDAVITLKANFTDYYLIKWGNVQRLYLKYVPEIK